MLFLFKNKKLNQNRFNKNTILETPQRRKKTDFIEKKTNQTMKERIENQRLQVKSQ